MGRLRMKPWAEDYLKDSSVVVTEAQQNNWKDLFKNDLPIQLEIGMGKGSFIKSKASDKEVNFIGIEKYPSVQVIAVKDIENEIESKKDYSNLRFISMDAEVINEWFGKGEVDGIFLNFSDPWPKERHAKRRLTFKTFLAKYYEILKDGGFIEFKTDQLPLFEFTLEQIEEFKKFKTIEVDRDLHSNKKDIITTEYERRFTKMGHPIYFVRLEK